MPWERNDRQREDCETSRRNFSDLRALFLDCTLEPSPESSPMEGLIETSRTILERNGVTVDVLHPVDFDVAFGVHPEMREHGRARDE